MDNNSEQAEPQKPFDHLPPKHPRREHPDAPWPSVEGIKAWLRLQHGSFAYMRMAAEVLLIPDDNPNRTRGGPEYTGLGYTGYVWNQFQTALRELESEGICFRKHEKTGQSWYTRQLAPVDSEGSA